MTIALPLHDAVHASTGTALGYIGTIIASHCLLMHQLMH
jgi:hypothetical protein